MAHLTINARGFSLPIYLAEPSGSSKGGIILIHEVWGLTPHITNVADRLAAEGFTVVAPDLISHTGITEKVDQSIMARIHDPATRDQAQKELRIAMAPIRSEEFGRETVARLEGVFDYFKNDLSIEKVAVMGFCFGGTYAYALAAAEPELRGALAFYGHAPEAEERFAAVSCPILAFYGEKDTALVDDVPRIESLMHKYGKDFEYKIYPGTGHAFMNDTNPSTYNEVAALDAWQLSLQFLNKVFA